MVHETTTPSGVVVTFEDGLPDDDGNTKRRSYKVDGERFPSVTTLLGIVDKSGPLMAWAVKETLAGRDYKETRDTAATRGTSVHDALEALSKDGTVPSLSDFPEEDRGYVQALCSWWLDHNPEPVLVEQVVASKRLRFAGRFDLLASIDGFTHLIDLKTSAHVYETHHLQMMGYRLALVECGWPDPTVCSILRVGEDGAYEFVPANAEPADFEAVVALYEVLKKVRRKPKPPEKVAA